MTPTELRNLIDGQLGEDASEVGMALYSSLEALNTNGRFYILGYNPANNGGNYTHLRDEKFRSANWLSYIDQCWHFDDGGNCGCIERGSFGKFQTNAQNLLRALHGNDEKDLHRRTFATNAIFLASARPEELGDARRRKNLWDKHWPVHYQFLKAVRPDYVIALGYQDGNSPYSLLRRELNGCGHELPKQNCHWKAFKVANPFWKDAEDDSPTYVVGLYHPSWLNNQAKAWNAFLSHIKN